METNTIIEGRKRSYRSAVLPKRTTRNYILRQDDSFISSIYGKPTWNNAITSRPHNQVPLLKESIQELKTPLHDIYLWDLPIRIFHWSLALLILGSFITAKIGGDLMDIHAKCGIAIIGLIVFRIAWGFIGSTYARFKSFFYSPQQLLSYLKGQWDGIGHNPLGALSIFLMLGLITLQSVTGLFSNDDITFNGPFFSYIEKDTSDGITSFHHTLSNILLGFITLHIVVIFFYTWHKKDNLISPMITGYKEIINGSPSTSASPISFTIAILLALIASYIAYGDKIVGFFTIL